MARSSWLTSHVARQQLICSFAFNVTRMKFKDTRSSSDPAGDPNLQDSVCDLHADHASAHFVQTESQMLLLPPRENDFNQSLVCLTRKLFLLPEQTDAQLTADVVKQKRADTLFSSSLSFYRHTGMTKYSRLIHVSQELHTGIQTQAHFLISLVLGPSGCFTSLLHFFFQLSIVLFYFEMHSCIYFTSGFIRSVIEKVVQMFMFQILSPRGDHKAPDWSMAASSSSSTCTNLSKCLIR